MRYSLHEIDKHDVVATTVAGDRDEALEWFNVKLRVKLTFEGDLLLPTIYSTSGARARPTYHTFQTLRFRFSWLA
jgi:hypothetical protein